MLYGYQAVLLTLREEHWARVIENIDIWAYEVRSKRTVWKKLHYEKLRNLLSSANIRAIKCAGMRRTVFVA